MVAGDRCLVAGLCRRLSFLFFSLSPLARLSYSLVLHLFAAYLSPVPLSAHSPLFSSRLSLLISLFLSLSSCLTLLTLLSPLTSLASLSLFSLLSFRSLLSLSSLLSRSSLSPLSFLLSLSCLLVDGFARAHRRVLPPHASTRSRKVTVPRGPYIVAAFSGSRETDYVPPPQLYYRVLHSRGIIRCTTEVVKENDAIPQK